MHLFILLTQLVWAAPQTGAHYERPCYTDGEDALTTHLQVQGNQWVVTHVAFEEEACTTSYLIYENQFKARVAGENVDLTLTEASYTTLTDEVTESLNWVGYCGFSDWKTMEKKVVTGLECDEYQAPKEGDVIYSIFKQEQQGPATALYLGESSVNASGKTPEERHTKLERLPYFLK